MFEIINLSVRRKTRVSRQHPAVQSQLMIVNGEDSGEILRKSGDRVVIRSNNGLEYSLHQTCQCVVGKVSIHPLKKIHIGSPNRLR